VDVPENGVVTKTPTPDELLANLDKTPQKQRPGKGYPSPNITKDELQQRINEMNSTKTAGAQ
jgi:hypothetical protein